MYKVFICDDDSMSLAMLAMMLQDLYEIRICDNPLDALEMIHKFDPDLIILDIIMPELNGIELCKQIVNSQNRIVPIIFLSACEFIDIIDQAFITGAYDYIVKPIDQDLILEKVNYCLETSNSITHSLDMTLNHMDTLTNALLGKWLCRLTCNEETGGSTPSQGSNNNITSLS